MPFLAFAKIDGIEGDSKQKGFEKQIEIVKIEHAIFQPVGVSAGGRGTLTVSQADHKPFVFYKEHDNTSPKLHLFYGSNGAHIPKVEVTLCRQAGTDPIAYMKYEFEDVVVAGYEVAGDITGDGLPEEKVSLVYGKLKVTYTDSDSTGKALGQITAEFDRRTGQSK